MDVAKEVIDVDVAKEVIDVDNPSSQGPHLWKEMNSELLELVHLAEATGAVLGLRDFRFFRGQRSDMVALQALENTRERVRGEGRLCLLRPDQQPKDDDDEDDDELERLYEERWANADYFFKEQPVILVIKQVATWSVEYGATAADTEIYVQGEMGNWFLLRRDAPNPLYAEYWYPCLWLAMLVATVVVEVTDSFDLTWEQFLERLSSAESDDVSSYLEKDFIDNAEFIVMQLDQLGDPERGSVGEPGFLTSPVYAHLRQASSVRVVEGRKGEKVVVSRKKSQSVAAGRPRAARAKVEYRQQSVVQPTPVVNRVWRGFWSAARIDPTVAASAPLKPGAFVEQAVEGWQFNCQMGPRDPVKNVVTYLEKDGEPVLHLGDCIEIPRRVLGDSKLAVTGQLDVPPGQPAEPELFSEYVVGVVRSIQTRQNEVQLHCQLLLHARDTVLEAQGQHMDLFASAECCYVLPESCGKKVSVSICPSEVGMDTQGDVSQRAYVLRGVYRTRDKKDSIDPYIGIGVTACKPTYFQPNENCHGCQLRGDHQFFNEFTPVSDRKDSSFDLRGVRYSVGDCVYIPGPKGSVVPKLSFNSDKEPTPDLETLFGQKCPNRDGFFRIEGWDAGPTRQLVHTPGEVDLAQDDDDVVEVGGEDEDDEGESKKRSRRKPLKGGGKPYVRPGEKVPGDAGDPQKFVKGTVRVEGFDNENWRERLLFKRCKEAHAHLRERMTHVPHEIGRIIAIHEKTLTLAMFRRPDNSRENFGKDGMQRLRTEREIFFSNDKRRVSAEVVAGRCYVHCRNVSLDENEFITFCSVPHHYFAYRSVQEDGVRPPLHAQAPQTDCPQPVRTSPKNGLRVLDLFSGAGGLSLGFEQMGFQTAWAVERDPDACETLRLHHPGCKVFCEDINSVLSCIRNGNAEYPRPGEVDVIVGGPPCQGFSGLNRHVERRKGEDPMNAMMVTYLSFIELLRPKYFVMENVKGLLSAADKKVAANILNTVVQLNYQFRFALLQAGHYGVPQDRKRVILFGAQANLEVPNYPIPTHCFPSVGCTYRGASMTFASTGSAYPMVTVWDALIDLPLRESKQYRLPVKEASDYVRMLRGDCAVLLNHKTRPQSKLNLLRFKHVPKECPGADWRDLPDQLIPFCLPNTADRHNDWAGLYGRLAWDWRWQCLLTTPNPFRSIVVHPSEDRIITVRECARAMGYPDTFEFQGELKDQYRQNGNAVPVPLARAIASEVAKAAIRSKLFDGDVETGVAYSAAEPSAAFQHHVAASYVGRQHVVQEEVSPALSRSGSKRERAGEDVIVNDVGAAARKRHAEIVVVDNGDDMVESSPAGVLSVRSAQAASENGKKATSKKKDDSRTVKRDRPLKESAKNGSSHHDKNGDADVEQEDVGNGSALVRKREKLIACIDFNTPAVFKIVVPVQNGEN